jgi:hypothetical protein
MSLQEYRMRCIRKRVSVKTEISVDIVAAIYLETRKDIANSSIYEESKSF